MSKLNGTRQEDLWHLVEALQRVAGGGCAKKVVLVAYFDATGKLVGREELAVVKLFPRDIFENLTIRE